MEKNEILEWCKNQDVVKISCIKVGEDDKFTFTVGEYGIIPITFDSQAEAEEFLEENFKLTNLDLTIIGAMCQKLSDLNKKQPKNKKK